MKLDQIVEDAVVSLGFSLWDKEFVGAGRRLVIYIDRPGAGITADDCSAVATQLKVLLRTAGSEYANLLIDVSSPGISRNLSKPEHYVWAVSKELKVVLRQDEAGRYQRIGVLEEVTPSGIVITSDGERQAINFADIKKISCEDKR